MTSDVWDAQANTFDEEPDHGLRDPDVRAAWRALLLDVLPPAPARIADIGCGTGSIARLLVDEGYTVHGLDFSPAMLDIARQKVPEAEFVLGDAASPELPAPSYDVIFSRHVLWALPDPAAAFARWTSWLTDTGIAVLVEGRWHTGGGLTAHEAERIVTQSRTHSEVRHLNEPIYWGKPINDERYLLLSSR